MGSGGILGCQGPWSSFPPPDVRLWRESGRARGQITGPSVPDALLAATTIRCRPNLRPSTPRAAAAACTAPWVRRPCRIVTCPLVETAAPHLGRQSLKCSNTVLGRGMGREQVVNPVAGERIDNEEMRGRRVALRSGILDLLGGV